MAAAMQVVPIQGTEKVSQALTQNRKVRDEAVALRVNDAASAQLAVDLAHAIADRKKATIEATGPFKQAAHEAWKKTVAEEKQLLAPLEEAEAYLKREVSTYHAEQQRIAREAQRKAEEEARRKAEEEREALLEKLEAERASGAEVAAVAAAPLAVAPAVVVAPPPKMAGVSMSESWKADVTDKLRLVQYVAGNPNMLHLLEPSFSALNAMAKAMKSAGSIPGVRFYPETRAALR